MIRKYLCLLFVVLTSACSSSSDSNNSDLTTDSITGNVNILGQVVDAVTNAPLAGVRVTTENKSIETVSGPDGRYELGPFQSGDTTDLRFTLAGYLSELYARSSLGNSNTQLGVVNLVPDDNMGTGAIGGTITDSQGNALTGALLRFFAGINVIDGTAVATTTTNFQGLWSVSGLEAGNYTCIIVVDDQAPIYETVQIIGGVDKQDADVVVPATTPTQIDFPKEGSYSGYGPTEVTWSFSTSANILLEYDATFGKYSVDRADRTGTITQSHFAGKEPLPMSWWESSVFILHSLAGSGVYPVVGSSEAVKEAAQANQAAAYVWVVAIGPMGTIGFDRLNHFSTLFEPPKSGSGNITLSAASGGRYRFDISDLNLVQSPLQIPGAVQPDAPDSIKLNLSNAHVP